MDWVATVLGPFIAAVLTWCGNDLWAKINHMNKLEDNLGLLTKALNELLAAKEDVLARVNIEERNGKTRLSIVTDWFTQVDDIEKGTNQLIVEASGQDTSSQDALPVHQRESTSCCWSTDNISNCSKLLVGEKVFKKLEEVRNLYAKRVFPEVTKQAPIPLVKRTGEGNSQCYMIYARTINITHSEKPENWTWSSSDEPPNEVAILKEAYWLHISGIFHTKTLTQKKKYEVVFVVKFEDNANGWETPVKLSLELVMRDKSENRQEQTLCLDDYYTTDEWVDIKAGEFVAPPKDASGKILFTMSQDDDSVRKNGLVVKGVAIRAVN